MITLIYTPDITQQSSRSAACPYQSDNADDECEVEIEVDEYFTCDKWEDELYGSY